MTTLVNGTEDMATRAQRLRAHACAMAGQPAPKHKVPPAPAITLVGLAGLVAWRGSAGAARYSVERLDPGARKWKTVCDRCAITAVRDLAEDMPLIIGTLGHAMVLTGLTYNRDVHGRGVVTSAVVRDP